MSGATLDRRALLVASAASAGLLVPACRPARSITDESADGTVEAAFLDQGYAPGELANLALQSELREVRMRVLRLGPEPRRARTKDTVHGVPMGPAFGPSRAQLRSRRITVRVGDWPSGLYFVELSAPGGRLGYAPLVVRPRRLGEHRVAVVLPTNTWQAYNHRDADGDGVGDTWYASPAITTVDLTRPYLNRGIPPKFRTYDLGFLRWLHHSGKSADFLNDSDLEEVRSGDDLRRAYDLIVFSGHEEYVTDHVYDVTERYRDLGGNLAFLSANNFFYRVERRGHRMIGRTRWRDLGRPEAALVGIQYVDWNQNRYPNAPLTVVGTREAPWFFASSGLSDGDRFGTYGIEIDARTSQSPTGTRVLARIPNIFGPGKTAEMAYYETPRGAKVFAAGVLNFGGSAEWPVVTRLLENLWARLTKP